MATITYTYTQWLGLAGAGTSDVELADGTTQNYFASTYTNWLNYVFSQQDVVEQFGLEGFKVNVNINQNDPTGTPQISITDKVTGITTSLDLASFFSDREDVIVKTGAKTVQVRWYSDVFSFTTVEENTAPVLNAIEPAQIDDTAANDSPADVTGNLSASDAENDELTFILVDGLPSGTAGETMVVNQYGTLFLNTATGAYRFEPNDEAINKLQAGVNVAATFSVKASDGALESEAQSIVINISGTNDTPELNADSVDGGSLIDSAADDTFSEVTGTLTGTDRDDLDVDFELAESVPSSEAGFNVQKSHTYGTLFLNTETGAYKFVANDAAIEGLKDSVTFDFSVNATDGVADSTAAKLTIQINATNDTPELNATSVVGDTLTDTAANDTFADITGTLTGSDRDDADVDFELASSSSSSEEGFTVQKTTAYGTLFLNTETGAYKFVANDTAIEGLKEGTSVTFQVNATDGTADSASADLTIEIDATNDTPELDAVAGRTLTDTAANDTFADITGTLTGSDRDDADIDFELDGSSSSSEDGFTVQKTTAYGTLFLNAETGAYKFVAIDSAIEALKTGETLTFKVNATDGTADGVATDLNITINATNDTPELNAASVVGGTFNDTAADDTFNNITGTLTGSDRDDADVDFELNGSSSSSEEGFNVQKTTAYGTLFLNTETGAYKFVANDAAIEALQFGDNPEVEFEVRATDGSLTSDYQTLSIQINGDNDAPRDLALTFAAGAIQNGNGIPGENTVIGNIAVVSGSDPDAGGVYTYSLAGVSTAAIGAVSTTAVVGTLPFTISSTGSLSVANNVTLQNNTVYEINAQVSQGAGDTLATYQEVFSVVVGTNASSEELPGEYDFSNGQDIIYGRQGIDIIMAGSGNDALFGQDGNDTLYGEEGDDLISGGAGQDQMYAGLEGIDTFLIGNNDSDNNGNEAIYQFLTNVDKLQLGVAANDINLKSLTVATSISFDSMKTSANQIFDNDVNGARVEYVFVTNGTDGYLFIDNGANGNSSEQAIKLVGVTQLANADIIA